MEKILVYRDESRINEQITGLEKYIESIQEIVDELAPISKTGLKDIKNLSLLFYKPKQFFTELLVVEEQTMQGYPLSKEKVFDLLELPEFVNEVIEKFTQFSNDRYDNDRIRRELARTDGIYLSKLEIVDQKVKIQESYLQDLENQHSIYITNENQQLIWDKLPKISEILSEISKVASQVTGKYPMNIRDLEKFYQVDHSGHPIIGDGNYIPNPKILQLIK